jgi:hypothetical protein
MPTFFFVTCLLFVSCDALGRGRGCGWRWQVLDGTRQLIGAMSNGMIGSGLVDSDRVDAVALDVVAWKDCAGRRSYTDGTRTTRNKTQAMVLLVLKPA